MAKSTFSGPIQSLAGFISAGNANVVSLTADTSITVADHAGKVLICNDADGDFKLPSIVSTAPGRNDDPNQLNNLGATFTFIVVTAATDMDIFTDGTDKFVGGVYIGKDNASGKVFLSAASNDVLNMNGSTKGGLVGTVVKCTAIATAKYAIEGLVLGSGTIVTPFADA